MALTQRYGLLHIPSGTILISSYSKPWLEACYAHVMDETASIKDVNFWAFWARDISNKLGYSIRTCLKEELEIIKLN